MPLPSATQLTARRVNWPALAAQPPARRYAVPNARHRDGSVQGCLRELPPLGIDRRDPMRRVRPEAAGRTSGYVGHDRAAPASRAPRCAGCAVRAAPCQVHGQGPHRCSQRLEKVPSASSRPTGRQEPCWVSAVPIGTHRASRKAQARPTATSCPRFESSPMAALAKGPRGRIARCLRMGLSQRLPEHAGAMACCSLCSTACSLCSTACTHRTPSCCPAAGKGCLGVRGVPWGALLPTDVGVCSGLHWVYMRNASSARHESGRAMHLRECRMSLLLPA